MECSAVTVLMAKLMLVGCINLQKQRFDVIRSVRFIVCNVIKVSCFVTTFLSSIMNSKHVLCRDDVIALIFYARRLAQKLLPNIKSFASLLSL